MSNYNKPIDLITILGPTAVGKTRLAALLADKLDSSVFSADSRQVYRQMDLGTGKDYADYIVQNRTVPAYLIDIAEPGTEYNIFEFSRQFYADYDHVHQNGKIPVFCGGSGLYLETILFNRHLQQVPENKDLRQQLSNKSEEELTAVLMNYHDLHNTTDVTDKNRLIRAIEIADFMQNNPPDKSSKNINSIVFGLHCDREILKKRITVRLKQRLEAGMIKEVQSLLDNGITKEQLVFYGLEYKYLALYLSGEIRYNDMFQKLNSAIHQFAKRQMTFFRHMEKNGLQIHWIESEQKMSDKLEQITSILKSHGIFI